MIMCLKRKIRQKKANSINEEINTKVVEYKENIWSRMIKFIKNYGIEINAGV